MTNPTTLALPLAAALAACHAADDTAEPEIAQRRCAATAPAPAVDAVLADSAPELAAGHERFGELLLVRFPADLDFDPDHPRRSETSKRRLKAYLAATDARLDETRRAYAAANTSGACAAADTAIAWVAYQLETAAIPALGDSEYLAEMEAAYCQAMGERAAALRQRPACRR